MLVSDYNSYSLIPYSELMGSGHADGIEFAHGKLNVGEAMATPVIRKVKEQTNREDVVIADIPPGTSCRVVESVKGSDFCILVTSPPRSPLLQPTAFGVFEPEGTTHCRSEGRKIEYLRPMVEEVTSLPEAILLGSLFN